MDGKAVPGGADGVMDHAVALDDGGVRVQHREAVTASREDTALRGIAHVEALAGGEGRVTEHDDGFDYSDY